VEEDVFAGQRPRSDCAHLAVDEGFEGLVDRRRVMKGLSMEVEEILNEKVSVVANELAIQVDRKREEKKGLGIIQVICLLQSGSSDSSDSSDSDL
jgi:hypothetical protein